MICHLTTGLSQCICLHCRIRVLWWKGYLAAAWQLGSVVTSGWRKTNTVVACCWCHIKGRLHIQNHIKVCVKTPTQLVPKIHERSFLFKINMAFVDPSGHSQEQRDSFGHGLYKYICDYTNIKSKQTHHSWWRDEQLNIKMQRMTWAYKVNWWHRAPTNPVKDSAKKKDNGWSQELVWNLRTNTAPTV